MSRASIIVPVYNAEKYINKCVDSILAQTYEDFELLLINDGSKDNSGNICDDYANKDKRVRVIHKENGGVSSARNLGLDLANGDYVMFVDSDDWLEIDALKNLYAKANGCSFVIAGYNVVTLYRTAAHGLEDKKVSKTELVEEYRKLNGKNLIMTVPWGKLYKRDIIEKYGIRFDTTMKMAEDTKFTIEFSQRVEDACFISEIIYNYNCTNVTSITKGYLGETYLYRLKVYYALKAWFESTGCEKYLPEERKELAFVTTLYYCRYYNNNAEEISERINAFYSDCIKLSECEDYIIQRFDQKYADLIKSHNWGLLAKKWNKDYKRKNLFKNTIKQIIGKFLSMK